MKWLTDLFAAISDRIEKANTARFNRWSSFLGRKMFLGLVAMLLLTFAFMGALTCALLWGGVEAMKALGTELWTGFCMTLGALFGAAAGTNVMEHNAKAKVQVAQAAPGATVTP